MPIRFRCAYCNQLMGISRRKAGTVVKCPKCAGEIIVPPLEGGAEPEPLPPGPLDKNDPQAIATEPAKLGNEPTAASEAPPPAAPIASIPPDLPPPIDISPPEPPRRGIFLTFGMVIVSFGVVVLLLILMFVVGLIIGKSIAISADSKKSAEVFYCPDRNTMADAARCANLQAIRGRDEDSPGWSGIPSGVPDPERSSFQA